MFLGLDLGTTNVKALVVNSAGERLGQGSCPVQLFHLDEGGVEQDLDEIWAGALSAIRQATAAVNPGDLRAVGVSSQGGAVQVLDAHGQPLGRVISWLDQRGRPHNTALTTELGPDWFLQRVGHGRSGLAIGQVLRLRQDSPGWLASPNRIGFVGDCIVARLCGRAAHDGTSAGLTLLYNPALRCYDPDVLRRLGLGLAQLTEVISARAPAGTILPAAARATGLPAGIPVSAAVHDQYAAALGTGAVHPGTAMLGAGTAWVLLAVDGRLAPAVIDNAFACHHVIDGLFGQIVSLVNGGSAFAWALQLMGLKDKAPGEIDGLLDSAPAGSDGVCCRPFLAPSNVCGLAPGTRGGLSGLQLSHQPAHLARAVVEGLGYELKRHLLFFERAGIRVEKLVMSGAAAASRVTPQILADITRRELSCMTAGAGSALGACIIARGIHEPKRSFGKLAEAMLPPGRSVKPGPNSALYEERFEEYLRSLPVPSPS